MKTTTRISVFCLLLLSLSATAQNRILVPLAVGLSGEPGGYGSIWKSELHAFNRGTGPVTVLTSASLCILGSCPTGRFVIPPGESREIGSSEPTMLLVSDGVAGDLSLNARVFDESRNRVDWGTELPLVSTESVNHEFALLNVPVRSGFRLLLRLYESSGGGDVEVLIRTRNAATGLIIKQTTVTLEGRFYEDPFDFAHTQLSLDDALGAEGEGFVHIEVVALQPSRQIWGFVSVTHNETQHVTLVTPQPLGN